MLLLSMLLFLVFILWRLSSCVLLCHSGSWTIVFIRAIAAIEEDGYSMQLTCHSLITYDDHVIIRACADVPSCQAQATLCPSLTCPTMPESHVDLMVTQCSEDDGSVKPSLLQRSAHEIPHCDVCDAESYAFPCRDCGLRFCEDCQRSGYRYRANCICPMLIPDQQAACKSKGE